MPVQTAFENSFVTNAPNPTCCCSQYKPAMPAVGVGEKHLPKAVWLVTVHGRIFHADS